MKIKKLEDEELTPEEYRLVKQLCKYSISFRKPYFKELFYSIKNDILRIDFEQAIQKLETTQEELFTAYEAYIIEDFNLKYNNIFKDIVTFRRTTVNNYLALKANEENNKVTLIEKFEDVKILDEEKENKVDFLRFSLFKMGQTYYLKDVDVKYGFSPYLILAKKNKVKNKKVEKIIESFLEDEQEYASKYLNADVRTEKTYGDENIEIYIVDKRG